jgi:hypothetical protein
VKIMGDSSPRVLGDIGVMQDRKDDSPSLPMHPRLLPAAQAKIERLRKRLRTTYADAAQRLESAVAKMRTFIVETDRSGAKTVLGELEKALADIRSLAVSELLDTSGLASLERQLLQVNEDLKALHDRSATGLPRGPANGGSHAGFTDFSAR